MKRQNFFSKCTKSNLKQKEIDELTDDWFLYEYPVICGVCNQNEIEVATYDDLIIFQDRIKAIEKMKSSILTADIAELVVAVLGGK